MKTETESSRFETIVLVTVTVKKESFVGVINEMVRRRRRRTEAEGKGLPKLRFGLSFETAFMKSET